MAEISIQQLLDSGAHFGHLTRKWNPKMAPFIFMERNGIHIIDLNRTLSLLKEAHDAVIKIVEKGGVILYVGTKKQAKYIIRREAERCGMFYVDERWLGGTLTNFATIKKSVRRLQELDKEGISGLYERLTKKEVLSLERERQKLEIVLRGIKDMKRLPDALIVVDAKKERIAVREAFKLDMPIFALIDTDSNPEGIEYPIPANDDSIKTIDLIVRYLTDAVLEGLRKIEQKLEKEISAEKPTIDKAS